MRRAGCHQLEMYMRLKYNRQRRRAIGLFVGGGKLEHPPAHRHHRPPGCALSPSPKAWRTRAPRVWSHRPLLRTGRSSSTRATSARVGAALWMAASVSVHVDTRQIRFLGFFDLFLLFSCSDGYGSINRSCLLPCMQMGTRTDAERDESPTLDGQLGLAANVGRYNAIYISFQGSHATAGPLG